MVQIGTIEYEAKVSNVADAQANAQDLTESQREMGEQATETAGATAFLGTILGTTAEQEEDVADEAEQTDEQFTLLAGTTWLLSSAMGRLLGIIGGGGLFATAIGGAKRLIGFLSGLTLSGILGSVTGALSSFVSWLAAGSAGALAVAGAIGAVIGLFGVWILEITGVLDWIGQLGQRLSTDLPAWARDGILTVIGLFAGPLAVIGGFIVGFIRGGFEEAFDKAGQVINIFFGAFRRTFNRLASFFVGVWDRSVSFVREIWAGLVSTANRLFGAIGGIVNRATRFFTNAWQDAKNRVVGFLRTIREWVDRIMGFLDDVISRAQEAAAAVRDASPVGGPGGSASDEGLVPWTGFPVDVPVLQGGGTIEQSGVAEVHKGEVVVPPGGMGGGGGGVVVEQVKVELSGDFDPSNVSRRDLERLADRIGEAVGAKTNRRSGVR